MTPDWGWRTSPFILLSQLLSEESPLRARPWFEPRIYLAAVLRINSLAATLTHLLYTFFITKTAVCLVRYVLLPLWRESPCFAKWVIKMVATGPSFYPLNRRETSSLSHKRCMRCRLVCSICPYRSDYTLQAVYRKTGLLHSRFMDVFFSSLI